MVTRLRERHWKATELYKVLDIYKKLYSVYGLPRWLSGKDSTCNAGATGDAGLIPGLGRSPGGGHGNPLQYPCLENPVNKRAWWATVQRLSKSWTQLMQLSMYTRTDSVYKL